MQDLDQLLNARGSTAELGAQVTAACFGTSGAQAAFALGDGTIRLSQSWASIPAHSGAVLAFASHPTNGGFCSGGDDGKLLAISPNGDTQEIANFGSKWVEHIATFPGKTPLIAASAGKNLHLFTGDNAKPRILPHPSTVTGIAFDTKGKRVAASHYNGASLWFTASATETPRFFEWKGSHIGVALHPGGDALVTAMQENALHGWTLPGEKHMRMAGYPAKPDSFAFTKSGKWLATSGADSVVLWPFFGGGPMGKAPTELGAGIGMIKRIAAHPKHDVLAAGYDSGMVITIDIAREKVLPVCGPERGAVTALAWNASGSHLALGTANGFAAVVNFS